MKKLIIPLFIALLVLCMMSGCKKPKGGVEPQDDPELPPKTQTGANTFGCRVNGVAWLPKGSPFTTPRLTAWYDPTYRNGTLNVTANLVTNQGIESIVLGSDSLKSTGTYPLTRPNKQEAMFYGIRNECQFYQGASHERIGTMIITKLDLQNYIVSGTFEFTLRKPECTVVVTNGRFDIKM